VNGTVKLSSPATGEFWEIPILHEDEQLLALDKPAGVLSSPDRLAAERPSLAMLLQSGLAAGKPWATERRLTYLAPAHRLDFDITGVWLLAKTKPALISLADQFNSGQPARQYAALVQGVPEADAFTAAEKLAPHPAMAGHMRVDSRTGKKSKTEFTVQERFSRWSHLHCLVGMERHQQILLHLSHVRFPVVGDETHGGKKLWLSRLKQDFRLKPGREERPLVGRIALHLQRVTVKHPVTGEPLVIQSELPKDMRVALKYLRQYGEHHG
jgi:RluA family pseudouridine synthase